MTTTNNTERPPRHMRPSAVHADRAQALLAQAKDYSAAADKYRQVAVLEAAYTEGLQATIKALGILQGISEADAHEMFMEALDA